MRKERGGEEEGKTLISQPIFFCWGGGGGKKEGGTAPSNPAFASAFYLDIGKEGKKLLKEGGWKEGKGREKKKGKKKKGGNSTPPLKRIYPRLMLDLWRRGEKTLEERGEGRGGGGGGKINDFASLGFLCWERGRRKLSGSRCQMRKKKGKKKGGEKRGGTLFITSTTNSLPWA